MLKIPEGMDWKRAAAIEPLAVAAYCIKRTGVESTDRVLIAGAGPIGLMLLMGLKATGVEAVYVTEVTERRRKKAEELGATHVFNPHEVKISSKMKELTGGNGVDVAIEAVGLEESLKDCLSSVKDRGKVTVAGIFTDRVKLHMLGFVTRETTMIGINSHDAELALEWIIRKGLAPETIITKIIPLERISTDGFEVLASRKGQDLSPWPCLVSEMEPRGCIPPSSSGAGARMLAFTVMRRGSGVSQGEGQSPYPGKPLRGWRNGEGGFFILCE
jgi:(R,R)-butanediol dehydrogenase/meso-butanediol dehydrogenase/diacetyl reductase